MLKLVVPTIGDREKALAFRKAFFDEGEPVIDGSECFDMIDSFDEWLSYVTDNAKPETLRAGCVLTDTFFAEDEEGKLVGIIDYRHELNDFFRDFGHCGYSVLPGERRKGYATEMLGLVCKHARECGAGYIQLSALRSNVPSVRTILKNGGVLERSFDFRGMAADVFVIELSLEKI